ncbi:hypothetical protein J437_LFUL015339 [Ladona fulva]|uniref:Integrase catalytic domain-containing protein n=1 Tax=Ladona fulva TaxID=123851 RepID=A0A8K0KTP1_LADFU|nr:hypothetical protein J437_LFUL015339 [Ladona fulva]
MPFYVLNDADQASLLGRKWIDSMEIELRKCCRKMTSVDKVYVKVKPLSREEPSVGRQQEKKLVGGIKSTMDMKVKSLVDEFSDLFDGSLGKIKGVKASLTFSKDKTFKKFWPARKVPFALEEKVSMELDRLDKQIEETVRKCLHCQDQRTEAAQAPVHPWEFPAKPWNRLHIDFAGPLHGFHWLVIVDARTKWPEVFPLKNATSQATINAISSVIACFGVSEQLVSDNGPQFTTTEFKRFCKKFQIQHVCSNEGGMEKYRGAEHFVRMLKSVLGKLDIGLDRLQRRPEKNVERSQEKQANPEKNEKIRSFHTGDTVWARDYRSQHSKRAAGTILYGIGPLTYQLPLENPHVPALSDVPTNQDISLQPRSPNPNLSRPPHADQTKLVHPSRRSERLNKGVVPKRLIEECQAMIRSITNYTQHLIDLLRVHSYLASIATIKIMELQRLMHNLRKACTKEDGSKRCEDEIQVTPLPLSGVNKASKHFVGAKQRKQRRVPNGSGGAKFITTVNRFPNFPDGFTIRTGLFAIPWPCANFTSSTRSDCFNFAAKASGIEK